jgi:hypothetical protein
LTINTGKNEVKHRLHPAQPSVFLLPKWVFRFYVTGGRTLYLRTKLPLPDMLSVPAGNFPDNTSQQELAHADRRLFF